MNSRESKRGTTWCRGFSLLEIMLGIMIFMIGMLGVSALLITTIKANKFSGDVSDATYLTSNKLEELFGKPAADSDLVDTDGDGTNKDVNDDNVDDTGNDFGLSDAAAGTADHSDLNQGTNGIYTVYWNIAVSEPAANCLTIGVITTWSVKGNARQVEIRGVRRN